MVSPRGSKGMELWGILQVDISDFQGQGFVWDGGFISSYYNKLIDIQIESCSECIQNQGL